MSCSKRNSKISDPTFGTLSRGSVGLRLFVLLLGIVVFQAPLSLEAKEYRFDYQRIVETGPRAELDLTYVSGDLEIISSDEDRIIIDAVKKINAVSMDEAEEVAAHIEIKVRQDDNKVLVSTNYLRMRNRGSSFWGKLLGTGGEDSFGEVDWTIQVPQGCRLSVNNTSGQISASHLQGDVDIRSSAADVELLSIEGKVDVETTSGNVTGELLFGPVTVRQAQGRLELKFVEGDIKVKSVSAKIDISQDRGALDLVTSTGNVDIQTSLDSPRDFFVETESGNITLSIPETSSGNLRIESQTGDIRTEIPIAIESMSRKQVRGSFGRGGVTVNLMSVSGNVAVAQF